MQTTGRRYDRAVNLRTTDEQYAALLRLVARGQYESPAHAIRRAITMLLSFHGEPVAVTARDEQERAA